MTRALGFAITMLCLFDVASASAQSRLKIEDSAQVFFERVVIKVPPPYQYVQKPHPPVAGFYAWRMSFAGQSNLTVVLRTDSALRTSSTHEVVRASTLRRCPADARSVLDCTAPLLGSARVGRDAIIIEITDPDFMTLVRQRHPDAIVRHVFEPGGRFRVNHIGLRYRYR
jgi:hypothetical protein